MFKEVDNEPYDRIKLAFLTLAFFCVIGGYTIAKELKDSIFMSIVGKEYVPWAKVMTMFILVPAILGYSKLVDKMRRYILLSFYATVFALLGIVFAYFLGHPTIGLANTNTGPYRVFGWFFYFFVEGISPFVVSVFWAFANSVNSPESAKKSYGYMVSGSKLGGMLGAGLAWILFSWGSASAVNHDVLNHQIALIGSSLLLLCVPVSIFLLMKYVPGKFLHGYEAVYKVEKEKKKVKAKTGLLDGLLLLIKYPYVLGIFGMVYFYEIVATVLSYLRLTVAESTAASVSDISKFLFGMVFLTHAIGFVISLVGTSALLKKLGERVCLLLIPVMSGSLLLFFMLNSSAWALMFAFVALKSINYAFSWPVRESLYIPTIKEIKFKSKSWIDAFGSKFAKTSGSTFNIFVSSLSESMILPFHSFFFASAVGVWFVTAFLLGRRFDRAIANNEVIGVDLKD